MTTPLFLLRCVQHGISIADFDLLTIGLVNDMFTERQNDDYAVGVARALDMLFQLSAREKLEFCHRMLDCYAENLAPYPYTHQIIGLEKLANKLMAESARSTVEAAICCSDLADFIKKAIELEAIDSAGDLYGDDDDLSRDEYIERDKRVLLYMKKHPEIRKIVEEQIGEPITSIWKDAEV